MPDAAQVLGVDFDNTLVRHEPVFVELAKARDLAPPTGPVTKRTIRDHLHDHDRVDAWWELQAEVYGPGMAKAAPSPGAATLFTTCRHRDLPVFIVSHRSRHPYGGPRHDLHEAARAWLVRAGFFDPDGIGLPEARVYFETSLEAKIARVAALGCTVFVDDLPKVLGAATFPAGVQRLLFDPDGACPPDDRWTPVQSFAQVQRLLIPEPSP